LKVAVCWDPDERAVTISHEDVRIGSIADVIEWKQQLLPQLSRLRDQLGTTFPIVVCLEGVEIESRAASLYGTVVKDEISQFASITARYGCTDRVRDQVRAEAIRNGYAVNLFETKTEALSHVRTARGVRTS
jgi:hypothetical protein